MNTSLTSTPIAHFLQSLLFFSEATHTFIKLFNDAATSVIPVCDINRVTKTFWSPEIPEVIAKHGKAIARKHCFGKNRQNYISMSKYISTVVSKAKAKLF